MWQMTEEKHCNIWPRTWHSTSPASSMHYSRLGWYCRGSDNHCSQQIHIRQSWNIWHHIHSRQLTSPTTAKTVMVLTAFVSVHQFFCMISYCRAKMYAGRIACCPLVSHSEYADRTDRRTDRRTSDHYIMFSTRHGQCKNRSVTLRSHPLKCKKIC